MNSADSIDLDAELQDDPSGARRQEVLARLRALQGDCQAAKRQLSDREGYRNLQAASIAVSASIRIIESMPQQPRDGN
jgi:hypothetical protein